MLSLSSDHNTVYNEGDDHNTACNVVLWRVHPSIVSIAQNIACRVTWDGLCWPIESLLCFSQLKTHSVFWVWGGGVYPDSQFALIFNFFCENIYNSYCIIAGKAAIGMCVCVFTSLALRPWYFAGNSFELNCQKPCGNIHMRCVLCAMIYSCIAASLCEIDWPLVQIPQPPVATTSYGAWGEVHAVASSAYNFMEVAFFRQTEQIIFINYEAEMVAIIACC